MKPAVLQKQITQLFS